ncbi:MAG: hypothetical protein HS129_04830 [Leptospiraceae bacterium]|nr:hypothetical protein [Leptospiraceae bacterium]
MENENYKEVNLADLHNGAAIELFALEWDRVMDNILDENVSRDSVRELHLKVKLKPVCKDGRVQYVQTLVECKSKIASNKGIGGVIYPVLKGKKVIALENNFSEQDMFPEEKKIKEVKNG